MVLLIGDDKKVKKILRYLKVKKKKCARHQVSRKNGRIERAVMDLKVLKFYFILIKKELCKQGKNRIKSM